MNKLTVSSSPHLRTGQSTNRIMLDVLIALLPTTVAGVIIFGLESLIVIAMCVGFAVLSEFLYNVITKKEQTIADLSAVVTGLLLALNLRGDLAIDASLGSITVMSFLQCLWQCAIGAAFAIVVVKCLFGGLGCNFANPAITGRIFMLLCFTGTVGGGMMPKAAELVSSATPLAIMKGEDIDNLPSLLDMFLGVRGGAIGEVCCLAIIIGFVYLVLRGVIHFETPLIFVGTVFVLSLIITNDPTLALYHVMSGGLLLGAVFMATDYVTTPITRSGKMIFALGCGIITVLIRFFGTYPEGVSFSILIMNILSPYIEKWTAKKPLGAKEGK